MPMNYRSALTGRWRKLSDGAMLDICDQYRQGERVSALAAQYGVSDHTIYSIVYWTPREVSDGVLGEAREISDIMREVNR